MCEPDPGIKRLSCLYSKEKRDATHVGTTPGQLSAVPIGAVISSPPFASSTQVNNSPQDMTAGKAQWKDGSNSAARVKQDYADYTARGNLATMAISSPPYADGCAHTGGADPHPQHIQGGEIRHVAYGASSGQLATMTVSSPPYEHSVHGGNGIDPEKLTGNAAGMHSQAFAEGYGTSLGQLGTTQGDTFWDAARQVVSQTYQLMAPGGHAIWVTKAYCRNGKPSLIYPASYASCESAGLSPATTPQSAPHRKPWHADRTLWRGYTPYHPAKILFSQTSRAQKT